MEDTKIGSTPEKKGKSWKRDREERNRRLHQVDKNKSSTAEPEAAKAEQCPSDALPNPDKTQPVDVEQTEAALEEQRKAEEELARLKAEEEARLQEEEEAKRLEEEQVNSKQN